MIAPKIDPNLVDIVFSSIDVIQERARDEDVADCDVFAALVTLSVRAAALELGRARVEALVKVALDDPEPV